MEGHGPLHPIRALIWACLKRVVRCLHPSAATMDTASLHSLLETEAAEDWLILDARTRAEFACSHLPGAVRIDPGPDGVDPNIEEIAGSLTRPILVVCAAGVRSAARVGELQRRGFRDVRHLEGGLFEWVNQGHRLVRQGRPTRAVHPCNRFWRLLLQPPEE